MQEMTVCTFKDGLRSADWPSSTIHAVFFHEILFRFLRNNYLSQTCVSTEFEMFVLFCLRLLHWSYIAPRSQQHVCLVPLQSSGLFSVITKDSAFVLVVLLPLLCHSFSGLLSVNHWVIFYGFTICLTASHPHMSISNVYCVFPKLRPMWALAGMQLCGTAIRQTCRWWTDVSVSVCRPVLCRMELRRPVSLFTDLQRTMTELELLLTLK